MPYYNFGIPGIRNLGFLPQNVLTNPAGMAGGMMGGFGGFGQGMFGQQQQQGQPRNLTAAGPVIGSDNGQQYSTGQFRPGTGTPFQGGNLNLGQLWTDPRLQPRPGQPGQPGAPVIPPPGGGPPPINSLPGINSLGFGTQQLGAPPPPTGAAPGGGQWYTIQGNQGGFGAPQPPAPAWTPAPLLNQAQAPQRTPWQLQNRGGGGRGGGGGNQQRGWKPLSMSVTTQSTVPGAGTGQYFPGTQAENANRQTQERVDAFLREAQRAGAPYSQVQAGVAAIRGGGMPGGMGGGGGGGGGNQFLENLIRENQRAADEANAANEARYQDILSGRWNLLQQQMAGLEGAGQQERQDIEQAWRNRGATMDQDLVSRGLTNTTVRDTQKAGNLRFQNQDLGRLNERLRQERLGLERQLMGDVLGFMERRTDEGPAVDWGNLMQLAMQLGAAGPGGGAGVNLLGGGGPQFASAFGQQGLFGNPFATMGLPMMGGRLGAGTVIRSSPSSRIRTPAPGRTTPRALPLPAASLPRLPRDIPMYV